LARKAGNPIDLVVGENLARIRKRKGVNQTAIAEALGVSFQQVQKYEKGTNRVSASVLFELAQAMSISMDDFFKGAEAVNVRLENSRRLLPSGDLAQSAAELD
jgi:transcriptional regulator with XRE-family HTH domain